MYAFTAFPMAGGENTYVCIYVVAFAAPSRGVGERGHVRVDVRDIPHRGEIV